MRERNAGETQRNGETVNDGLIIDNTRVTVFTILRPFHVTCKQFNEL